MVVSRLIGGLGNQMFQYAAGRALAVANKSNLKLDISGYKSYELHNGYELDLFNIQAEIASNSEIKRFVKVPSRLSRFLTRKFELINKSHFVEKRFAYDPSFFDVKQPIYIDGYWQSYKYFESIESKLKIELTPKTPLSNLNLSIADKITQVNAISLHVRRGDYVSDSTTNKVHGFLGLEYYEKAIEIVNKRFSDPYFFVFSDDMLWARQNLGLTNNVMFIDHNSGKN